MSTSADDALQKLYASSVSLVKKDGIMPTKVGASGCMVSFADDLYLLTVKHVKDDGIKHIVIEWDPELELTATQELQNEMFIEGIRLDEIEGAIGEKVELVYYPYNYPKGSLYQKIVPGGAIEGFAPNTIFPETKLEEPQHGVLYAFGGHTQAELKAKDEWHKNVITRKTEYFHGLPLSYEGKRGRFHVFRLPGEHPGHKAIEGCSGAPIIDAEGNVVALVNAGVISENLIYGVPIFDCIAPMLGVFLPKHFTKTGELYLPENIRAHFGATR